MSSGPRPSAIEFATTESLYDFVIEFVLNDAAKRASLREIAVLSLSYSNFDQIKAAGKYRKKLFVIDSREDLMKVQYAGKRIIYSSPEYVSGFQFQTVLVCDVNMFDSETGERTTWQDRRFASLAYLAASRARQELYFLGDKSFGGLADIITAGIASNIIERKVP